MCIEKNGFLIGIKKVVGVHEITHLNSKSLFDRVNFALTESEGDLNTFIETRKRNNT